MSPPAASFLGRFCRGEVGGNAPAGFSVRTRVVREGWRATSCRNVIETTIFSPDTRLEQ